MKIPPPFITDNSNILDMEQQTAIEKITFGWKDIIIIVTVVLSVVTNQLTLGSQIRELSGKFQDYQIHQEQLNQNYRELITLQLRTIELRLDKLENQKSK